MVKDQVKQEELLNKLERELDRMNDILTNFLNISKPMPEKKQEPVNLNQVLQELLFLLNSEALLNEIDLEINFSTGKPLVVLGSPDSIKQVFLNIARNAIEAMENGGKLSISTSLYNGRAQVTFQDNGPGIPEENMATLTKPFFYDKARRYRAGALHFFNHRENDGRRSDHQEQSGQRDYSQHFLACL
jgi:two-component system, sporulation sensor kinase D